MVWVLAPVLGGAFVTRGKPLHALQLNADVEPHKVRLWCISYKSNALLPFSGLPDSAASVENEAAACAPP